MPIAAPTAATPTIIAVAAFCRLSAFARMFIGNRHAQTRKTRMRRQTVRFTEASIREIEHPRLLLMLYSGNRLNEELCDDPHRPHLTCQAGFQLPPAYPILALALRNSKEAPSPL